MEVARAAALLVGSAACVSWLSGADARKATQKWRDAELQHAEFLAKRARLAHLDAKETWTLDELKRFDGSDENGPILLAADGIVYNVWKGRHFYGKGCEYAIFAGAANCLRSTFPVFRIT